MDKNKLVSFIEYRGYKINAETRDLLYDKLVGRNGILVKYLRDYSKHSVMHGGLAGAPLDWDNKANSGTNQYSPGNAAGTNTDQSNITRQAIPSTFQSDMIGGGNVIHGSTQNGGGGSCEMCQSGGHGMVGGKMHKNKPVKYITIRNIRELCKLYNIEINKNDIKTIANKLSAEVNRLMQLLLHNSNKKGIVDKKAVNTTIRG